MEPRGLVICMKDEDGVRRDCSQLAAGVSGEDHGNPVVSRDRSLFVKQNNFVNR